MSIERCPLKQSVVLANATVAAALVGGASLVRKRRWACNTAMSSCAMAQSPRSCPPGADYARAAPRRRCAAGLVLPRFVDGHTHLDKGHILHRAPNPDGTFLGARTTRRRRSRGALDRRRRRAPAWTSRCAAPSPTAPPRSAPTSIRSASRPRSPGPCSTGCARPGKAASSCRPPRFARPSSPLTIPSNSRDRRDRRPLRRLDRRITFMGTRPGEKLERALDIVCSRRRATASISTSTSTKALRPMR